MKITDFPGLRWSWLAAVPFLAGLFAVQAHSRIIRIEPGINSTQVLLRDVPAGTHFDAAGLILHGGQSGHFQPPPRFCLLSDPRRDPEAGFGYPSTGILEKMELSNEERYPVQLRDMENPSLSGASIVGVQSRDLPWRVMKAMWDGDGLVVRHCRGEAEISDVYFENVEDGFGPQEYLDRWTLRNACMRYIRDDAIENDFLIPGRIENCLIDGCFVFLSCRPDEARNRDIVTTIRNCAVHVEAQPHDGVEDREWRDQHIRMGKDGIGRAPGMLFKWSAGGGSVAVENCVFRVDALAYSGPGDMGFPPGHYENVTLVWSGAGDYPMPLPPGVTLTRDISVWNNAKSEWIDRLDEAHPAARVYAPKADRS